jgi:hypothetical protein
MKRFTFLLVVFFSFILSINNLFSQEVISSAGGNSTGVSKQVSWTIGEPVIETDMNGLYILTQGLHQGNLIVTAVRELEGLNFQISAYPNPVSKFVKLDIGAPRIDGFSYALFSTDGQLLRQEDINDKVTTIPMDGYTHSSYLLRVMSEGKEIKVFRVVKNR